jgi:large subunit ribosomal protein L19
MNRGALLKVVEKKYTRTDIPLFKAGDTVRVNYKVVEGTRTRIQSYEGVVIRLRNNGFNSAFTVRKISFSEGVERVFPFNSPLIDSVEIVARGKVRRAKLYYMRDLRGKAARIRPDRKRINQDAVAQAAANAAKAQAKAEAAAAQAAAAQAAAAEAAAQTSENQD